MDRRGFWWENLRKRNHLENLLPDGDNIKWILNTIGSLGLDSSGSGQGQVADCCERGNENGVP
jgi:hypothetical protein